MDESRYVEPGSQFLKAFKNVGIFLIALCVFSGAISLFKDRLPTIAIDANNENEIFVLLVWFCSWGMVCAVIATIKGRSAILWFLIGASFAMFALIIVLVLPNRGVQGAERIRQAAEADRRVRQEDEATRAEHKRRLAEMSLVSAAAAPTRACPYCAEPIKSAAIVCRFCNRDVEPAADALAAQTKKIGWGRKTCATCGLEQKADRIKCFRCENPHELKQRLLQTPIFDGPNQNRGVNGSE